MRAQLFDAQVELVVELEDLALVLGAVDLAGRDGPIAQRLFAHAAAHVGVVADRLGDDVARAGQGVLDVGHVFGQVGGGQGLGRLAAERLVEDQVGQRLEAALAGDAGARAPLLLVGRVEVFQLGLGRGGLELGLEFGRQLALFRNTGDNGSTALVEGAGVFERLDDGAQLFLVEAAGHFLAVAGDKGQRVARVEQLDGGADASRARCQAACRSAQRRRRRTWWQARRGRVRLVGGRFSHRISHWVR